MVRPNFVYRYGLGRDFYKEKPEPGRFTVHSFGSRGHFGFPRILGFNMSGFELKGIPSPMGGNVSEAQHSIIA